jgi:hypothetical protein
VCRAIWKENPGDEVDSFTALALVLFAVTHFIYSTGHQESQELEASVI